MARLSDLFYLDDKGIHVPDMADVYSWLADEFREIYGQDVVLTEETQDGQWLYILSQAMWDTMQVAEHVYNSFSPATALSDALDRNVQINGIRRKDSLASTCDVILQGKQGTILPGCSVKDDTDRVWNLPERVIIPASGEITVTATASQPGTWEALPHTLTVINTPVRGWYSADNPLPAAPGVDVETDADLRRRQTASVAAPALTVVESTYAAVSQVSGVTYCRIYENDTGAEDENGIPGHSICAVVAGGDVTEIARAIHRRKTPGTGTFGNTEVEIADRYGLVMPIRFERPVYQDIAIKVQVMPTQGYSTDDRDNIKKRLVQFIASRDIGDDVYVMRLVAPALDNNSVKTFDLIDIWAAKAGEPMGKDNIELPFSTIARTSEALIEVLETDANQQPVQPPAGGGGTTPPVNP